MKKTLICVLAIYSFTLSALPSRDVPVLEIPLNKYPAQKTFKGGIINTCPPSTAFIEERGTPCLSFNGRDEILEITHLSKKVKDTLKGSFTFEFDFFTLKLPVDEDYYHSSNNEILLFKALDKSENTILSLEANKFNRFSLLFRNNRDKDKKIFSTWNIRENHEVTSIIRGKWYKIAVTYDNDKEKIELYLDNILIGCSEISGYLKNPESFIFGGPKNIKKRNRMLRGGIKNIKLFQGVLHNKRTSEKAMLKAWERLHRTASAELSKLLLPENPEWSRNHPRMLLTPTRLQALKATLRSGRGKELKKRLIKQCESFIDPESPEYLNELKGGHHIKHTMKPAVLALGTLLTGKKKYAEHAAKIVSEFTKCRGYNDMTHQLVMSAGSAKPTMAITLTYDWAYDYLSKQQKRKIRLYLLETAKGTYDFYTGKYNSTAKRDALKGWVANWTALSISTLGNCSLAILGETKGRDVTWLNYAKFRAAQYGMFAVGMDGCFHEMPGYLGFGAAPLIVFMEALYTAGGEDLLKASNFSKIPDFLAYLFYPCNRKFMPLKYSRKIIGLHRVDSYIMALLRKRLKTKAVQWDWQKLYNDNPWNKTWGMFGLIWFEPEREKVKEPGLPLGKWFKSEGLIAFRSGWDKDAVAGIFMAYPARIMAHDQSDRGQFTLYGFQGRWVIDNGGRADPEHAKFDAHNLVTIDNGPNFKPRAGKNYHHDAFITNFCHMKGLITAAEADLTRSYRYILNWQREPVGTKLKRGIEDDFKLAERKIIFMREKSAPCYLLVFDNLQKDNSKHLYTLNLHTDPRNEVKINKSSVKFHQYPVETNEKTSFVSHPYDKNCKYYYTGNPKAGYAEYSFNIPQKGKYNLYGLGCPGEKTPGAMDSFFIQLKGQNFNWGTNSEPDYRWSRINNAPVELKAGRNTLRVLLREPEAKVAKFAICPASTIPVFDNPSQEGLILINAGNTEKIEKGFIKGEEQIFAKRPEAFMALRQLAPHTGFSKDIFKGTPVNHYRIKTSVKAVKARFLNFFYPYKPDMQIPEISSETKDISLVEWEKCTDIVCLNNGNKIKYAEFETDSDLAVIRMNPERSSLISFSVVNGSYLKYKNKNIIKLRGGPGTASWSGKKLVISGKNVYNFEFTFPSHSESGFFDFMIPGKTDRKLTGVKAQGLNIKVIKTGNTWSAETPFISRETLSW